MARYFQRVMNLKSTSDGYYEIHKSPDRERVYFHVQNNSSYNIELFYDFQPAPSELGVGKGTLITPGQNMELWYPFAPDNEIIWIVGSQTAAQNAHLAEAYRK